MNKESKGQQGINSNPDNIATILGIIGVIAIIVNLFLNGVTVSNILDAIKDIMGLSIAVGIYWIANRIYATKKPKQQFHELFEEKLHEWAIKNKYLIEPRCIQEEGKIDKNGKMGDHYRCYKMVADHTNLIHKKLAADEKENSKAVFIKLPFHFKEEGYDELRFFLTSSSKVFLKPEKGITSLKPIVESMTMRIRDEFSDAIKGISVTQGSDEIIVNISSIDKSATNQDKTVESLIDLIDFVKILYLAQA